MSSASPQSDPDPDADAAEREQRRSKLIGRLIIIGFGLLLAVYLVPMFWGLLWPAPD